ncbi:MAG: hypothetical protein LDL22_03095, partial [Hyphomicrobiales bacterium]|nr:hypothetical protein [Hyphomicrobiales bacterium]
DLPMMLALACFQCFNPGENRIISYLFEAVCRLLSRNFFGSLNDCFGAGHHPQLGLLDRIRAIGKGDQT